MAIKQYNRLTFDRNQDTITKKYRVFRSTDPVVSRNSVHVMDITHPESPNPVFIEGAILTQMTTLQYKTKHRNLFTSSDAYPQIVYVNGLEAVRYGYTYIVDTKNGYVKFKTALPAGAVVTMDYYFDGIRVIDCITPQPGVTFYGPMAQDNSVPKPPVSLTLNGDNATNAVVLGWQPGGSTGEVYYYRVDAIDEKGDYSQLCASMSAYMSAGYDLRGYVVERCTDGELWEIIGRTGDLTYSDPGTDKTAPYPVTNVSATVTLNNNQSTGEVSLQWTNPSGDPVKQTGKYRLRVISSAGQWSDPSEEVGPIYIETDIAYIVIRRKVYDGNYPTYTDPDATTIIKFSDPTTSAHIDTASDNTTWAYSIFRVDVGGNYSLAGTALASIGNATPPPEITSIDVNSVDLIY